MIEDLGLTATEWLLYRGLLWNPRATLRELTAELSTAEEDIAGALARLESAGLVVESSSTPSRLRPVYPQIALQRILNRQSEAHDRESQRLRGLTEEVAEFTESFVEHRKAYEVSLLNEISDPAEMTSRVNELTREARSEILSFVTHTITPASLEQARRGDRELLDRGDPRARHLSRRRPR